MSGNLFTQFFAARQDSTRPFIERGDGGTLTYRDTMEATARLAHRLVQLGVKPGDRVAAQVERSVEAIHLYLACLRVGGVYLPLNTAYTLPELEYFVGDARPALVVCSPDRREAVKRFAVKVAAVETLDADGKGSLMEGVAALPQRFDDIGAHGRRPRGHPLHVGHHGALEGRHAHARQPRLERARARRDVALHRGRPLIHALPLFHTHGLFVAVNVTSPPAPRSSCSQVRSRRGSALFARRDRAHGRADLLHAPAAASAPRPRATRPMRLFISGSAPLSAETHDEWRSAPATPSSSATA
jgi:malonyl-CoA/methylmalonyl-CoA synthetase